MKKMIAALAAAAMLCCTLVSPVSAAETYRKGDVNMDGVVNAADACLVLNAAAEVMANNYPDLTEEQMQLANITGFTSQVFGEDGEAATIPFGVVDSQVILLYYAEKLAMNISEDEDIVAFYEKLAAGFFEDTIWGVNS